MIENKGINYIIATTGKCIEYDKLLNDHIYQVLKHKKIITQITIVRPLLKENIDNYYQNINFDNIQILDYKDIGHCFGQYLYSYSKYPNFSYYIFISEDYIPIYKDFDDILLNIFYNIYMDKYGCLAGNSLHPNITSYFFFNNKTLQLLRYKEGKYFHKNIFIGIKNNKHNRYKQIFIDLIIKHDIKITNCCDLLKTRYYNGDKVIDITTNNVNIELIIPIQSFINSIKNDRTIINLFNLKLDKYKSLKLKNKELINIWDIIKYEQYNKHLIEHKLNKL